MPLRVRAIWAQFVIILFKRPKNNKVKNWLNVFPKDFSENVAAGVLAMFHNGPIRLGLGSFLEHACPIFHAKFAFLQSKEWRSNGPTPEE